MAFNTLQETCFFLGIYVTRYLVIIKKNYRKLLYIIPVSQHYIFVSVGFCCIQNNHVKILQNAVVSNLNESLLRWIFVPYFNKHTRKRPRDINNFP